MISLHYGLPKLINNEDDDNDLPIESDFDDITLTQLPLPFPGEPTRMSPFLCYIKMAKLLSSVLKELYTTTRRRNGTHKIEQLTRELQVWQSLSETTITTLYNVEQDLEQDVDSLRRETASIWLHLLGQMALIYIHRPALTFESHEPQFQVSLDICSEAASTVLSILEMARGDGRLLRIFPSGPNLIFQCALLCLYRTWHDMRITTEGVPRAPPVEKEKPVGSSAAIDIALGLLGELHGTVYSQPNHTHNISQSKTHPLVQASQVLRYLANTTARRRKATTLGSPHSVASPKSDIYSQSNIYVARSSSSPSQRRFDGTSTFEALHLNSGPLPAQDSVIEHGTQTALNDGFEMEFIPDFLSGDGNGLDYLNQMDESTWTFLSQMGGYSGEAGGINYS